MKIQALVFPTLLLACAVLPGQGGITASLSSDGGLARMGTIELTLVVDIAEETDLDSAVLNGLNLEVTVEGQPAKTLREGGGGQTTRVAAGTQVKRRLSVDLEKIGPLQLNPGELTTLSFNWPGLQGASALIKVAPDVSGISIGEMDMEKTRVMLSTSLGEMTLAFYPQKAPHHVENFLRLSQARFYDGTQFHRILSGFMVQGGCPNTKEGATGMPGTGGPGWTVNAEFNDVKHVRGILSMARSQDPDSAGSQFFIVHGQASHLDGKYTAFGALESGFDTLDKIASMPVGGPQRSIPLEPVHVYYAIVLPVLKTRP